MTKDQDWTGIELTYSDSDFAPRARRLIVNGIAFGFTVDGEAALRLAPFISNGALQDPGGIGLIPKLHPFLGVAMLAIGRGTAVTISPCDSGFRVTIGVGVA